MNKCVNKRVNNFVQTAHMFFSLLGTTTPIPSTTDVPLPKNRSLQLDHFQIAHTSESSHTEENSDNDLSASNETGGNYEHVEADEAEPTGGEEGVDDRMTDVEAYREGGSPSHVNGEATEYDAIEDRYHMNATQGPEREDGMQETLMDDIDDLMEMQRWLNLSDVMLELQSKYPNINFANLPKEEDREIETENEAAENEIDGFRQHIGTWSKPLRIEEKPIKPFVVNEYDRNAANKRPLPIQYQYLPTKRDHGKNNPHNPTGGLSHPTGEMLPVKPLVVNEYDRNAASKRPLPIQYQYLPTKQDHGKNNPHNPTGDLSHPTGEMLPVKSETMARMDSGPFRKDGQRPQIQHGLTTSATIGIVVGTIILSWIIIGPILCLASHCIANRQTKKKRHLLPMPRASTSASMDEGIVEALVFGELATAPCKPLDGDLPYDRETQHSGRAWSRDDREEELQRSLMEKGCVELKELPATRTRQ